MPAITVIIPTRDLSRASSFLAPLIDALKAEAVEAEILLVTAGDPSGFVPSVAEARALSTGGVDGFAPLCNAAARRSSHSFLLFLNDDVETPKPFVANLLKCAAEDDVFAVVPPVLTREGGQLVDEAETSITWKKGFLWTRHKPGPFPGNVLPPHEIPYAVGACMLVKKGAFLGLGGFDERYSPAYWEDVDLSYRAIKRGYRVLHCPAEAVMHRRGETTSRIPPADLRRLYYR
ncbi:MAG: glycosyltransferase, partial [bacterium]